MHNSSRSDPVLWLTLGLRHTVREEFVTACWRRSNRNFSSVYFSIEHIVSRWGRNNFGFIWQQDYKNTCTVSYQRMPRTQTFTLCF